MIHETAVIEKNTFIAEDVRIGPFCFVGEGVRIGSGCRLNAYVVIQGSTHIGKNNHFFQYSSIGASAQSFEQNSSDDGQLSGHGHLVIGDNNVFRENSSVDRGVANNETRIGSNNLVMAYSHFSYACKVGDYNVIANRTHFSDSVHVGHHSTVGAGSLIASGCRVGSYAMVGGRCVVRKDIPAFVLTTGSSAKVRSIAEKMLKKKNLSDETIKNLQKAFSIFYTEHTNIPEALAAIRGSCQGSEELEIFLASLYSESRVVMRHEPEKK